MAVYQGTRRDAGTLILQRAVRTTGVTATRGAGRVVSTLAALLVAFLLGLFYLTQTLGVATADYEIGTLLGQREGIDRQLRSVEGDIARWGAEPAIVSGAQAIGFDRLGDPIHLPAR
jgi:hypothetical protein